MEASHLGQMIGPWRSIDDCFCIQPNITRNLQHVKGYGPTIGVDGGGSYQ